MASPTPLSRAARLSRWAARLLVALPALLLAWDFWQGALGPRPIAAAITDTGLWSLRVLLASLAVTPTIVLFRLPALNAVRRTLGVASLGYAGAHFGLYLWDQQFLWGHIGWEILSRFFLSIGTLALLAMAVLGSTSNDAALRRLGPARFQALHRASQPILVLALWHGLLVRHGMEAMVLAGLTCWLLLWRRLQARGLGTARWALALLALVSAALTAGFEAAWYAATSNIPVGALLAANWDWEAAWWLGPRPAGWVLLGGLVVAALSRRSPPAAAATARSPGTRSVAPSPGSA